MITRKNTYDGTSYMLLMQPMPISDTLFRKNAYEGNIVNIIPPHLHIGHSVQFSQ